MSITFLIKSTLIFWPISSWLAVFNTSRPALWSISVSPPGNGSPVTSKTGSLSFSTVFPTWSGSDSPPRSETFSILRSMSFSPPSNGTCNFSSIFSLLMWLSWTNSIYLARLMNSGAFSGSFYPPSTAGWDSYWMKFGATRFSAGISFFSGFDSLASSTARMFSD